MVELEKRVETLTKSSAFEPISRINLIAGTDTDGTEHIYTAGTDTGRTLEAKCPWATQAMADALLNAVKGYVYQPYTVTGALLDPAAELGDGVSVDGVVSQVISMDTDFDALYTADISAPQDDEVDHEYPYIAHEVREQRRQVATITAALKVGLDGITAEVANAGTWDESGVTIDYYGFGAPQLPVSDNTGKTYLDKSSGYVYTCNGTSWIIGQSPLPNVSASLSSLKVGLDGITAKVTDGSGHYTVLNLKNDALYIGDGTSVVTINGSSITANSIGADRIKTNELVVGTNIAMGENATISWSKVTSKPSFSAVATSGSFWDLTSRPSYIGSTEITETTITSPTIIAGTFYASDNKDRCLVVTSNGIEYRRYSGTIVGDSWTIAYDSNTLSIRAYMDQSNITIGAPGNIHLNAGNTIVLDCYDTTAPDSDTPGYGTTGALYFKI